MSSGVELREVRTFLALADELHFGRAAERLGVTPSRVSQTIRQLELRVGGRLFERTSRRVALTATGEALRRDAAEAVEALEQALAAASGVAGVLRIGMYSRCNGGPRFVEMVKAFEARHPDCRVAVVDTGFARDQLDWLRRREVDLLAMRLPLHDPALTVGPELSCEPRVLAVAADDPLAARESVAVEDFADRTVPDSATLPREMLDAFIPPRTPSGRVFRRTPHRAVAEAPVRVALGEMVHPTVPSFLEHYPHPGVVGVPIRDLPPSRTALVWLTAQTTSRHEAFAEVAAAVHAPAPV